MNVTLPPPWNEVKGMAIDGGMVFRLPAKTREEVDALRRLLDAEPTLREKRGKPLTYDLVAFYDLVADDLADVKKTVGMLVADRFLVRIEGESNGVLRVSTISPRGFKERLKQEYNLGVDDHGRLTLTSKTGGTRPRSPETGGMRPRASETKPPLPPAAVGATNALPKKVEGNAPAEEKTSVMRQGVSRGRGSNF